MSLNPVYIEASDEITTVIERLRQQESSSVALVAPKGAALLQSIVNLKLIKKAAKDAEKEVILVSTDKIGRNLATQIGLPYASTLEEAQEQGGASEEEENTHVIGGVKIHRYYDEAESEQEDEGPESAVIEPIIPKRIFKEASAAVGSEAVPEEGTDESEEPAFTRKAVDMDGAVPASARPKPKNASVEHEEQKEETASVDEKEVSPRRGQPAVSPRKRKRLLLASGLLVSLLIIGAGTALLYLPYVEVKAFVPATPWQKQVTLEAAVSKSETQIPATLMTAESSQSVSFQATGSKEIGEKAAGTATIFNSYSSDAQRIPAGTTLSFKGHDFTTNTEVSVPGARVEAGKLVAGSASVKVTATLPGPDSNLSTTPGSLNNPPLITQLDSSAGGSSKQIAVITDEDISKAQAVLETKLREETKKGIAEQSKGKEYLIDESSDVFTMEEVKSSVQPGAEKDSGEVSSKAVLKRLAVKKEDALQEANRTLAASLPQNTVLSVKKLEPVQAKTDITKQTVSLVLDAAGTQSTRVQTDSLPKQLAGKSFSEGTEIVHNLVQDKSVTISRTPGWWPRLAFPYLPTLIHVRVQYE